MLLTKESAIKALRPIEAKFITPVQKQAILHLQLAFEEMCSVIFDDVPECADRTAAFRKLLECKMTCVQAVTHHGYIDPDKKEVKKNGNQKEDRKEDNRESEES